MRCPRKALILGFALAVSLGAAAQRPLPELRFDDPRGFYRSAVYPPADYSSQEVDASFQVYPFRAFQGDIRQAFSRTRLRELIDPRYQEGSILPDVQMDAVSMPGADVVLRARFRELTPTLPRLRMRVAIVSGSAVAILDATANSPASWGRIEPQLAAFANTLRIAGGEVSAAPLPTQGAPAAAPGRAVAGLYMALRQKYETLWKRYVLAAHYYLFSADGRVYRAYDELRVPGNDPARFDFAAAQRADPDNSGSYVVRGESLHIRIGVRDPETFSTRLPAGGVIVIGSHRYERQ